MDLIIENLKNKVEEQFFCEVLKTEEFKNNRLLLMKIKPKSDFFSYSEFFNIHTICFLSNTIEIIIDKNTYEKR